MTPNPRIISHPVGRTAARFIADFEADAFGFEGHYRFVPSCCPALDTATSGRRRRSRWALPTYRTKRRAAKVLARHLADAHGIDAPTVIASIEAAPTTDVRPCRWCWGTGEGCDCFRGWVHEGTDG